MAQEGETLCLVCGNKPPVSIDNYQVIVKEKHLERILPEYSSLEDAWEMLKGVQFYREYKGKSNVFQWLNQSANVCFLCMDKVITLAVAVHDITSLLNAKEKDMQRRISPVKPSVAPQNSTQPLEKQPPMGSSEDDPVIICEKSAKQNSSSSQQSRRRASQPPEIWITKKESSQNTGKQLAASKAGTKTVAKAVVPPTSRQPAAKAVVPPTSRQPAASTSNTRARSKSLGRILPSQKAPVPVKNTNVPVNKVDSNETLAQGRPRRDRGRSFKERNPDFTDLSIKGGDNSNSNSSAPSETGSNFDEEVILIHQTAPKDVILEQVVHKSSDREYFAPPTPTPTPSPEILQDNVKNGIRPADKDRRISFNTTTMSMPTKRTVVPTLKKRESMGVTHSTSALQNKNKSAVNESQPKEKLAGATGNLKQAGAADLQAGKRRINSEPPAVAAAADILPAKRARAPSAKMKEADGDGLWKKIAGSEEFNRANTVRTNKATRRSAPAPGTSATIMPKNPTVSTSKDVLEDWKSPEFRAQQLTKLNKVLNEGKWGIRSGDNMEKEVFKTAASKDAYMQGIANLVSHFGGQIPIFPAKDKQNKVVPKTTLQTKERRRSSIPRPNRVALGTFAGKEISVADSKNVTDKDVTRRKSIAVIRMTNAELQVPLEQIKAGVANCKPTQEATNATKIAAKDVTNAPKVAARDNTNAPKIAAKPPLEPELQSTKSNATTRRRSVPAVPTRRLSAVGVARKPVMTRKSLAPSSNDATKPVLARKSVANETDIQKLRKSMGIESKKPVLARKSAVSIDNTKTTDNVKENNQPLDVIDEVVQINDEENKVDENKDKISGEAKDKSAKKKMLFKKVKTLPQTASDKVPLRSASKVVKKTEKRNILEGRGSGRQICPVCGILQGATEYVNHLKKEHGGGRCSKCPRVFDTEKDLNLHMTQTHQKAGAQKKQIKSTKAKKYVKNETSTKTVDDTNKEADANVIDAKDKDPKESQVNRPMPLMEKTLEESGLENGCDFSMNDTYGENWGINLNIPGITAIPPKTNKNNSDDGRKSETADCNTESKKVKVDTELSETQAGPSRAQTKAKIVVKRSVTGKVGKRNLEDEPTEKAAETLKPPASKVARRSVAPKPADNNKVGAQTGKKSADNTKFGAKTGEISADNTKNSTETVKGQAKTDKLADDGKSRPQRNVRSLQERNPDFVISDEYKTKSKLNSQDENSSESAKNKSVKLLKDVEVKLNSISNSLKQGTAPVTVFNRGIINETMDEDDSSRDSDDKEASTANNDTVIPSADSTFIGAPVPAHTSTPYPHADTTDNDITITPAGGISLVVNEVTSDDNNDDTVPIGNDDDNTMQSTGFNEDDNKTTKDSPDEETIKLAVDTSLESADEPNEGDKWFTINKE